MKKEELNLVLEGIESAKVKHQEVKNE